MGFTNMTEIQHKSVRPLLEGRYGSHGRLAIGIAVYSAGCLLGRVYAQELPVCSFDLYCVGLHIQPALKALNYVLVLEEKCSLLSPGRILTSELGVLPRWLRSVIEKGGTWSFSILF